MKNNSSQIIQKLESQIPSRVQQYSDLYSTYLYTLDDAIGSCCVSEKEFFDKLNIDQNILKTFQKLAQTPTQSYLDQIDMYAKYGQEITQIQISGLKTYDNFLHIMMESYATALSQFSNFTSSQKNQVKN
ncbi:hypothetical protein C5F50_10495 [Nitrosopumilus ureiphilus]|uniref:Uncharacterized protein n=2 Tax=Nitrosopumilus ureiphilus TaxID=1470067 RepID=A0A7D5MC28_9ARCH|nr:hypothetical protein C5F50_10495 [Nitrosopumilus ureiphilus]